MKRCPFCAEEIQDAAIVCKHCSRDVVHVIGDGGMPILLSVFALGIAGFGSLFVSAATAGVAIMAFALLVAVFARIAQANWHHNHRNKYLAMREFALQKRAAVDQEKRETEAIVEAATKTL